MFETAIHDRPQQLRFEEKIFESTGVNRDVGTANRCRSGFARGVAVVGSMARFRSFVGFVVVEEFGVVRHLEEEEDEISSLLSLFEIRKRKTKTKRFNRNDFRPLECR